MSHTQRMHVIFLSRILVTRHQWTLHSTFAPHLLFSILNIMRIHHQFKYPILFESLPIFLKFFNGTSKVKMKKMVVRHLPDSGTSKYEMYQTSIYLCRF
jgi:hypothetical protein